MRAVVVAASIVVCVAACAGPGRIDSEQDGTAIATAVPSGAPQMTPTPEVPRYELIGQTGIRGDGESVYLVLVDQVDPTGDGFKQTVRAVLDDLAKTDGGPAYSAQIFDDRAVATEASAREPSPAGFEEGQARHLVAMYTGGVNTGLGYPYNVSWYPGAVASTPGVGRYVDSEQWLPGV